MPLMKRIFKDPRGFRCQLVRQPDLGDKMATLIVEAEANEPRKQDLKLPAPWSDCMQCEEIVLWDQIVSAPVREKLALLVKEDAGAEILKLAEANAEYRTKLNDWGPNCWTPLYRAVAHGCARAAEALIQIGADPHSPSLRWLIPPLQEHAVGLLLRMESNYDLIAAMLRSNDLKDEELSAIADRVLPAKEQRRGIPVNQTIAIQRLEEHLVRRGLHEQLKLRQGERRSGPSPNM